MTEVQLDSSSTLPSVTDPLVLTETLPIKVDVNSIFLERKQKDYVLSWFSDHIST